MLSVKIYKVEGYTVPQTPDVALLLLLLSTLACFSLQKMEVKRIVKEAMQENEMLLS